MQSLQLDGNDGKGRCAEGNRAKKSVKGYNAPGKADEVERSAKAARLSQRGREGEGLLFPSNRAKKMCWENPTQ